MLRLASAGSLLGLSLVLASGCDAGDSSIDDLAEGGKASPSAGASPTAGAASMNKGGSPGVGGAPGVSGTPSVGGAPSGGTAPLPGGAGGKPPQTSAGAAGASGAAGMAKPGSFGNPVQTPHGFSDAQYEKSDVQRSGVNYFFMANGWGENWKSHYIEYQGTSFNIETLEGTQGQNYSPAAYPTMFCGAYSDSVSGKCGLPALLSSIKSIKTGWSWAANGNTSQYNAAYDIWIGNTSNGSSSNGQGDLTEYLMVWYRDPPGQQPAGQRRQQGISVPNVQGTWDFWQGQVAGKPYYAYVKPEGQDIYSLEFDVMDFVKDLPTRSVTLKGNTVLSVAIGFEIWNGPIKNLATNDFYVTVE